MPSTTNGHSRLSKDRAKNNVCFSCLFRFSKTMMFMLAFTYAIVVLLPLLQHQTSLLSNSTSSLINAQTMLLDGWGQNLMNRTSERSCETPKLHSDDRTLPIQLEPKNRTITLVHIGKAGGVSLRRMTVVFCKLFFRKYSDEEKAIRLKTCTKKFFPDPGVALAHSVKHYVHLEEYNQSEVEESTSFLLTLRNPVDRVISTFRFSHPGNCNDLNRDEVWHPRGCQLERAKNDAGLIQNILYFQCFPSPAMEDFAQSLMRPWTPGQFPAHLSKEERQKCRYLARELVQGHGTFGSGPHMMYNFAYYAERTVWKYPKKEVFGVRTEYEMEDIKTLDALLGGNGNLRENTEVSHGSETYVPSPLTTEAYQKLCCVLEMEIEVYEDLLMRVVNLHHQAKQEAMDNVKEKCGVTTSWTQWRYLCRRDLRNELRLLEPSLVVNETYSSVAGMASAVMNSQKMAHRNQDWITIPRTRIKGSRSSRK